ncbi:MAG: hypothetical protein R2710_05205 [Acidimicrobiales bacterium]
MATRARDRALLGRLERFFTRTKTSIQVVSATTAAQFFHLLRRQVLRDTRKPLVVFTPKSGLRGQVVRTPSPIADLLEGSFRSPRRQRRTEGEVGQASHPHR